MKQKEYQIFYKFFFGFLLLIFSSACVSDEENQKEENSWKKYGQYFRNLKPKPSESMQVGINSKSHFSENKLKEEEDGIDYSEDFIFSSKENPLEDSNLSQEEKKYTGYYKIGNPYKIDGISYYPKEYDEYEETGIASWYGDEFVGKKTANDEIYNSGDITAAHRTLPMPSLARVTNLKNGKSLVVRINDRGPFAKERIIDLSQRAAEILGYKKNGTTEVKVELLKEETQEMLKQLKLKSK
jgi:rare lipoprotein A